MTFMTSSSVLSFNRGQILNFRPLEINLGTTSRDQRIHQSHTIKFQSPHTAVLHFFRRVVVFPACGRERKRS